MTRSKGPAEELSLPPTRMRKDVSTANEGEKDIQGQVQANVASQQRTVDMQSPFAQPGSRAGTCTTPTSDGGMLPKASNPFTRPDSRAGSAPPEPTPPQSSVSSTSDNQLREDANTSVSWDLVNTDTDAEVANINSSLPHQTVTDQHSTGSTNTTRNNAVGLSNEINTLYNQDFFVADTTGRRLSQVMDKSNYSSLLPNGNAALQLRLPDLLIYLKTDTYLVDVKTGHHYAVYHNRIEKMSVLPKLYSAWPYRQLLQAIHDDAVRFGINSPEPATSKQSAPVAQPSLSIDRDVQTANKQHPSPCMPTIVNYEPPSFNLQNPKRMLTRSERDQVLRNHMTATNTTFNKVAVLEDLMRQEPHNAAHYKEVQRVQKNQHISTPPPPQLKSQTAIGRTEIINFTKSKILPNPEASSLTDCDDNSATRVLAAAVYCQLERKYFDETHSRHEVAALFRCNTSQLSKAITGVEYKSGPHHYKPQKATKRTMETAEQQTGPSKRKALPSTSTQTESTQAPDPDVQADTLSSSSDSDLPLGLPN